MDYQARVNWRYKNDQRILVADYTGLSGEEFLKVFNISYQTQKAAGKDIRLMVIFTNGIADSKIVEAFKKAGKELDQDMKKTAIVGVSPLQSVLVQGYLRFTKQHHKTKIFKDTETAMSWLGE